MKKIIALSLLVGAISLSAQDQITISIPLLLEQIGKFHPIILHFPVVLMSLLPLFLIISYFSFGKMVKPLLNIHFHFTTIFCIVASILGVIWASVGEEPSTRLILHRNAELFATALMAFLSSYLIFRGVDLRKRIPPIVLFGVFVAAAILSFGAHVGGELTHGSLFILW